MFKPTYLLIFLLLLAVGANAQQPMTWITQGVFDDTGTFGGMFTYNPSNNVYNGINVVTTAGTKRTGNTYLFVCGTPDTPACGDSFSPNPTSVAFQTTMDADQTGEPTFFTSFSVSLATAFFGSTVPLFVGGTVADEGACLNSVCTINRNAATTRFVTGGTTATTAEPLFQAFFFN